MAFTAIEIQSKLLTWYAQGFPERKYVEIAQLVPIVDGWESDIFSYRLAYQEVSKQVAEDVILKIYHGEMGAQKVEREFYGLRHLASAGYPVPRAFHYAVKNSPFGNPFVMMEKIRGRKMADIIAESAPAEQQALLSLLCKLFVALHELDWQPFTAHPEQYKTAEFIRTWVANSREFVRSLSQDTFDPVLSWLAERSKNIACTGFAVTHNDFHRSNILLKEDGTAIVIDWPSIGVSDFRFDLAWTLLLLSTYGHPEWRDFVLREYERISGQPVEQIEFFEVIASASRLFDLYVSLSAGAATLGMRPETAALMRQKGEHFQAVYALLQERTGVRLPEIEQILANLC
jgi:aminoglycoside phosphotransferase (APT) family kinase protein